MPKADVKNLESTNPNQPPEARLRNVTGDWYAYNRRADIVLLPSGKKSAQFYRIMPRLRNHVADTRSRL